MSLTQIETAHYHNCLVFSEIACGTGYASELEAMKSLHKFTLSCLLGGALLPLPITSEAQPATQISAGSSTYHSLFLKSDGSLWGMGYNQWGQLGIGKYNYFAPYGINLPTQALASNVTAIAVGGGVQGQGHSLLIESDGSLWGMGNNTHSQLGLSPRWDKNPRAC